MEYVVVDFEWNQSSRPGHNSGRLPFEIIEIGAVKLDEDLREIGRFSRTVRPKVYKKLHYMTRELTGISQQELDGSDPFPYVLVDFMLWCGNDFIFCTWGNTDLVELQRNMRYFNLEDLLVGPIRYYNVQKLFRIFFQPQRQAASLESAAELLEISGEGDFHRAVNDAAYTAKILQRMDPQQADRFFSVDYYQYPRSREEEIHLTYEDHYKYISRDFPDKEAALADREVRAMHCYMCGRAVRQKIRWFSGRSRFWFCLAWCPEHGWIRGKIRIKHTDTGRVLAVKTIRMIDEGQAAALREMKTDMARRRREKRHKDHEDPSGGAQSGSV